MRFFFFPTGIALLCAWPLLARATPQAPPAPITLEAAIQRAFDNNPSLRAAGADIDIAAGQRLQAGAVPNPSLSYLSEGIRHDNRTTTLLLSQPIELGGKRGARITLAERERDVAAAELAMQRNVLRANVVSAFFDVLTGQQRGQLAQASLTLAQQVTGTVARRVTAGKVSPVEESRARVAEASARIALSQASSELAMARGRLAATWGSTGIDVTVLETPAQPPARPVPLAEAPQIVLARSDIARQQAAAAVERSRRSPDVTVSVGTRHDVQSGIRQAVIGVALPLPLFDRNQGNLLSALRRTDKAKDTLLAVESSVALDLAQATLRRDAALDALAILQRDILPGAESTYAASTRGFELGKFGFLEVLDAQRTLFEARQETLRALADSYRASADIDRIAGTAPTTRTP
ncbi:MAG: TolC family protein [Pseudomonadota bacterium]|nr:TolC family protein [Pseudomonadota bacterium]